LQVDRAATALLRHFRNADDSAAFRLLVELTTDRLEVDAETIIRDLALSEVPDPEEPQVWEDAQAKRKGNVEAMVAHASRISFHRLDLNYCQVLRAKDIAGLSISDIAIQRDRPYAEVEELLLEARKRLARVVDDVLKGPSK
jgi:DNA-directed RNA polymerase specialized sigma24 family protein